MTTGTIPKNDSTIPGSQHALINHDCIHDAIKCLIREKKGWDEAKAVAYILSSEAVGKPIYEMLCEIDNHVTYFELAKCFSVLTGIELSATVDGEIIETSERRHIKALNKGSEVYYIWHPLATRGLPQNSTVRLLSREVFVRLSGGSSTGIALTAKDRLMEILKEAIKQDATDIHLIPVDDGGIFRLRFRVLGDLHEIDKFDYELGILLTSQIIIMAKQSTAGLRVDEKRRPQGGRIKITSEEAGRDIDIRLSIIYKDNMRDADLVMRLLYKTSITNFSLESLGFLPHHVTLLKTAIVRNQGIVIVTGATGTGKSKTVNTMLSMVPTTRNVMTVEDPIEYHLPNGRQFQTIEWENDKGKLLSTSFAEFSRAFKRHDPDVIFIGELRDSETVQTAFHLAKTGHLVFTTLHASRATIIPELLIEDYGIKADVIADNLLLGVNQTLVKRLCDKCKKPVKLDAVPDWLRALRFPNTDVVSKLVGAEIYEADTAPDNPCPDCRMVTRGGRLISVGYSGRTLLAEAYEFMPSHFRGGLSAHEFEERFIGAGNILTDAVEKIKGTGIVELAAIRKLL